MSRKVVMAGKLINGVQKPDNLKEIVNKINKIPINKKQKYILFIATIRIIGNQKEKLSIIKQLEELKNDNEIYNNFNKSKYISNIVEELKKINKKTYISEINLLIEYVQQNNIEI